MKYPSTPNMALTEGESAIEGEGLKEDAHELNSRKIRKDLSRLGSHFVLFEISLKSRQRQGIPKHFFF